MQKPQKQQRANGLDEPKRYSFAWFHQSSKMISELVTSVIIVYSFSALVVGSILIYLYLDWYEVSYIPFDASLVMVAQIFLVFFIMTSAFLTIYGLLPFIARHVSTIEMRSGMPNLFGSRLHFPTNFKVGKHVRYDRVQPKFFDRPKNDVGFVIEYVFFYFSIILLFVCFCLLSFGEKSVDAGAAYLAAFCSSVAFCPLVLRMYSEHYQRQFSFDTYTSCFLFNAYAGAWIGLTAYLLGAILDAYLSNFTRGQTQKLAFCALVLVSFLLHALFSYVQAKGISLFMLTLVVLLLLSVYPGYAALCASALRQAKLGGGVPFTFVDLEGRSREVCLVLAMSNHLLVSGKINDKCPMLNRNVFSNKNADHIKAELIPLNKISLSRSPLAPASQNRPAESALAP